jgi:cellulose 1,4-beta-cellobiosidase
MYMMQDASNYEMFRLRGKEFTFDVDVSQLPCGVNGALYFVEMSQNGDQYQGNNAAGAKYGTGYCDAQCPHDVKFMNGKANIEDWNSSTAVGKNGSCCAEMDIWEANSMSTSYTLHPCNVEG